MGYEQGASADEDGATALLLLLSLCIAIIALLDT